MTISTKTLDRLRAMEVAMDNLITITETIAPKVATIARTHLGPDEKPVYICKHCMSPAADKVDEVVHKDGCKLVAVEKALAEAKEALKNA